MGNIPVHPDESRRRPVTSRKLEEYFDERRLWNATSVANEGMAGLDDSAPNTTYGRSTLSRVRLADREWINEAQTDDLDDLIENTWPREGFRLAA